MGMLIPFFRSPIERSEDADLSKSQMSPVNQTKKIVRNGEILVK